MKLRKLVIDGTMCPSLVKCDNLKVLIMNNIDMNVMNAFDSCKKISKLHVGAVYTHNRSKFINFLLNHNTIKILSVSWTMLFTNNVLDACRNIVHLRLYELDKIIKLDNLGKCERMKSLRIIKCNELEYISIVGCRNLEYIDVFGCNKVMDVGSLKECDNLKVVRIGTRVNLVRAFRG